MIYNNKTLKKIIRVHKQYEDQYIVNPIATPIVNPVATKVFKISMIYKIIWNQPIEKGITLARTFVNL